MGRRLDSNRNDAAGRKGAGISGQQPLTVHSLKGSESQRPKPSSHLLRMVWSSRNNTMTMGRQNVEFL